MKSIKDDRGYNQIWTPNNATRIRAERRCNYMIAQMNRNGSHAVMEIGCGTGENAFMLARKTEMQVLGVDLCAPFIEKARSSYRLNNLCYEVRDFNQAAQFKEEKFDCIVGNGILHHLYHHLDEAFSNMRRLLNDGGRIVFLEPNLYNPYVYSIFTYPRLRRKAALEPGEMAFSKRFIIQKLERAGFSDIKVEYRDFLLPVTPDALIQPSIAVGSVVEKSRCSRCFRNLFS